MPFWTKNFVVTSNSATRSIAVSVRSLSAWTFKERPAVTFHHGIVTFSTQSSEGPTDHHLAEQDVLDSNTPDAYKAYYTFRERKIKELLQSNDRFQKIGQREFRSSIPKEASQFLNMGKLFPERKGITCMKGPLDIVIYSQLFSYLKPATVFEIGSLAGGTAIQMADELTAIGIKSHVFSMDLDQLLLDPRAIELKPPNLTFIEGDCYKIEEVFPPDFLKNQPHPWIVVEDAHVNSLGVLEHFHKFLEKGDYLIYEDTDPEAPLYNGLGWGSDEYVPIGNKKHKILTDFLKKYEKFYAVDSYFTDMFGYNATNNWNGYICRVA